MGRFLPLQHRSSPCKGGKSRHSCPLLAVRRSAPRLPNPCLASVQPCPPPSCRGRSPFGLQRDPTAPATQALVQRGQRGDSSPKSLGCQGAGASPRESRTHCKREGGREGSLRQEQRLLNHLIPKAVIQGAGPTEVERGGGGREAATGQRHAEGRVGKERGHPHPEPCCLPQATGAPPSASQDPWGGVNTLISRAAALSSTPQD